MDWALQIFAGLFYLSNKILFAIAETRTAESRRRLKIAGWLVYLLGVPPWVIILIGERNWIAASIELGGIPAMLFGLHVAVRGRTINRAYEQAVSAATYSSVALGIGYSMYQYGGIASMTQLLEMGVMAGFLLGGYLLAKENPAGWLCFALMNLSMGTLMLLQDKPLLAIQQAASLGFVVFALVTMCRRPRTPQPA